jgi:hypothetical protein
MIQSINQANKQSITMVIYTQLTILTCIPNAMKKDIYLGILNTTTDYFVRMSDCDQTKTLKKCINPLNIEKINGCYLN